MEKVTKNGLVFGVKDRNQRAAFLNAGWKSVEAGENKSPASQDDDSDTTGQDKAESHKYSKSEIMRMSTADLKEVAKSLSLEVTEESTGKDLKEEIITKLGL